MSLLGIDIGTTGCKSAVFSEDGRLLALAYREYDPRSPRKGWAELDSREVWQKAQETIAAVAETPGIAPIRALAVASLGEAVVPVTWDREVLGPSLLNYDLRGQEYAPRLAEALPDESLYPVAGVPFGNHFSLPKLMWIKEHDPALYGRADFFLPWTSFISFMLGADPAVDYSLASRTLLFDLNREDWSERLLSVSGLDREKLATPVQAGTVIGQVSDAMADALHLPRGLPIVIGAHDQCANAVGCGAIDPGQAMLGMGTFTCAVPVYARRRDPARLIPLGVNTEHHAVPGRFVSFVFNQGGSVVKWFRDTFAGVEKRLCAEAGEDVYTRLFAEAPPGPSSLVFLPYFSTTGLPDFSPETSGVMTGLRLTTSRGEILKGIIESIILDLKMTLEPLGESGLTVDGFIAVGGGSKSETWMQVCADILGCSIRPARAAEGGALGSAIIAAVGSGLFADYAEGVEAMVRVGRGFEPNRENQAVYRERFKQFLELRNRLDPFLQELAQETLAGGS